MPQPKEPPQREQGRRDDISLDTTTRTENVIDLESADREERIANADRAAEQAGIPGVDLPESPFEVKERLEHDEPPTPDGG